MTDNSEYASEHIGKYCVPEQGLPNRAISGDETGIAYLSKPDSLRAQSQFPRACAVCSAEKCSAQMVAMDSMLPCGLHSDAFRT